MIGYFEYVGAARSWRTARICPCVPGAPRAVEILKHQGGQWLRISMPGTMLHPPRVGQWCNPRKVMGV